MISRVLVANRGEIARRVFRTCERLRIGTVAIYSATDADSPHVREADTAVRLEGSSPAETYLDHEAVIEAALASGADAIHPGYGFLSENGAFAAAVDDAGLVWIGPSASAIDAMGSKIEAKSMMVDAGVPCLPDLDLSGLSESEVLEGARQIGYPLLVKASAGGGGKGMRTVADEAHLMEAVDGAIRESEASFGDGTVFLEKCLTHPRHIEIQVFGDSAGTIVALHERECSIQRRHQKIIEECPSPVMTPELRAQMSDAAVSAARAVGYVGAGTVEFLFEDGAFYFLEMNTRLQVEHPVTEMVTGLDLVELQIRVAEGLPLPPDVGRSAIRGHAIEARLYAEDPANGFLPVTGPIHDFVFAPDPAIRVDSGVAPGSNVSVHFDPMLAKVIAHGESREGAAAALASALRGAKIHASTTNRDLLVRILEHPDFLSGDTDTGFIDRIGLTELARPLIPGEDAPLYATGAAIASRARRRDEALLPALPPGFRNVGVDRQSVEFSRDGSTIGVVYETTRRGLDLVTPGGVEVCEAGPSRVVLRAGERTLDIALSRYGDVWFADTAEGSVRLVEEPRFPDVAGSDAEGSLHAPMPGRIVRIEVGSGDRVEEGAALIVLEAMKMEHTLRAPHDGVVADVNCEVGDQVEANDVLIVVD